MNIDDLPQTGGMPSRISRGRRSTSAIVFCGRGSRLMSAPRRATAAWRSSLVRSGARELAKLTAAREAKLARRAARLPALRAVAAHIRDRDLLASPDAERAWIVCMPSACSMRCERWAHTRG